MDKKSNFSRKVYITYKSRINAAERLNKTEKFIQVINIYYSIFITILGIYSFNNITNRLSLMITIFSVIVTITIVFLASQKYGERAKSLKNNYIALFRLYNFIEQSTTDEELNTISNQYSDLLDNSENHAEYDYYKAILSIKDIGNETSTGSPLDFGKKTIYYSQYWGSILLKIILVILPLLLNYLAKLLECIIKL